MSLNDYDIPPLKHVASYVQAKTVTHVCRHTNEASWLTRVMASFEYASTMEINKIWNKLEWKSIAPTNLTLTLFRNGNSHTELFPKVYFQQVARDALFLQLQLLGYGKKLYANVNGQTPKFKKNSAHPTKIEIS
jgi:hypothetical protein